MATKAKRKLSEISFENQGAHIALVSKTQGGPANGHDYSLIMKGKYSQEVLEKAQQIQVTMELPEFLEKFFHLWGSDAEVLARLMGYVPPEVDDQYDWQKEHEDYIQSKVDNFTLLKSLKESDNLIKGLSELDGETYLAVLKSQETLESIIKKAEEGSTEAVAKAKESDDKTKAKVEPSGDKQRLDKSMEKTVDELKKALDDKDAVLQKALDTVAALEKAAKDRDIAAKTAKVKAVVKNSAHAETLVKAALAIEDNTEFEAYVAVLAEMQVAVEKSALFEEQGVDASQEDVPAKASGVAEVFKAKFAKTK